MAKTSQIVKSKRSRVNPKYSTRRVHRCALCGRQSGYMRDFDLCRICFRELANKGVLPGVRKSSW